MTTVRTSSVEDVKAAQAELLFPAVRPYYADPPVLVDASGAEVS